MTAATIAAPTTTVTQPSSADLDAVAAEQQIREITLPPTPEDIDALILEFAQKAAAEADKRVDEAKARLVKIVDAYGHVPPHAEQSRRLQGKRNAATVTRGTTIAVDEAGVAALRAYLNQEKFADLMPRFFAQTIKHSLVDGARDVLKTLTLSRRVEEKIASLFGRAIEVKSKAPSLKIETIKPEKPARTPRGKKAA